MGLKQYREFFWPPGAFPCLGETLHSVLLILSGVLEESSRSTEECAFLGSKEVRYEKVSSNEIHPAASRGISSR